MATNVRSNRFFRADWGLLFVVLALLVFGLVMVYSASYGYALIEGGAYEGRPTYFVKRQAGFAIAGLVAMFIFSRIDYRYYQRYAVQVLGLTLAILLPAAIMGRWVLKAAASIQPDEFAKLGAMIYIAVWLASKSREIRSINLGLVPFSLLLGFIAALIMIQPHFSTAVILVATATAMFFAAGADMRQLLILFVFGGIALTLIALLAQYRSDRLTVWWNSPFSDALGKGFQAAQTLFALIKGGGFGVGLGQSQQKFVIYAGHSDGIFAIIAEELGFVGALFVMGLYGLFAWRGLRIALHAPDNFGRLLAVGLVSWVVLQALVHIAVNTATTPFTGTVLPFISAGGSSLVSGLMAVGVLLNISHLANLPREERAP